MQSQFIPQVPEIHRPEMDRYLGVQDEVAAAAACVLRDYSRDYEFFKYVCNSHCVLPQRKVQYTGHLPAMKLTPPVLTLDQTMPASQREEITGWVQSDVLIILPNPQPMDISAGYPLHMQTSSGRFLRQELEQAGHDLTKCAVTHVCRFGLPAGIKSYGQPHISDGAPYVHADIVSIKPKVIIACGASAIKALYGPKAKVTAVHGTVLQYVLPDGTTIPVVPSSNPLQFLGGHGDLDVFRAELRRAKEVMLDVYKPFVDTSNYLQFDNADDVESLIEHLLKNPPRKVAFDTEWGNDVARNEYRYTLSIQLCWGPGRAAIIWFRKHEDVPAYIEERPFGPTRADGTRRTRPVRIEPPPKMGVRTMSAADEKRCWEAVAKLLRHPDVMPVAHHARADVEEFNRAGVNIDDIIPKTFDTMLVHHLLHGDASQGLDHLVRKYSPKFGAYWQELDEYITSKGSKITRFGYRNIPPSILGIYGLKDADATYHVSEPLEAELNYVNAHDPKLDASARKHLYWNHVSWTSLHLLDVQRNGILVDDERRMKLREFYLPIYEGMLAKLREEINWPDFSPTSKEHVAALLFDGYKYKDWDKHKKNPDGTYKAFPPEGTKTLGIKPLVNTDKYPRDWDQIISDGEELLHTPSTKAKILDVLAGVHKDKPILKRLVHLSALGKFLNTYLQPVTLNEYGVPTDGSGFHCNIWADGRVRTDIGQLTETGRYTSKNTNLQTSPKKQEAVVLEAVCQYLYGISAKEYEKRTFDGKPNGKGGWSKPPYSGPDRIEVKDRLPIFPFKSCYMASPGYKLIEVDFKTAEICAWAYMSRDPVLTAIIDEGRDLHSETACTAFKIEPFLTQLTAALAALKAGDRSLYDTWASEFKAKYSAERTVAKTIVFGIAYGRGVNALYREILAQGVETTLEACEQLVKGFSETYAKAWQWIKDNQRCAVENEYVETVFGRRRYFTGVSVRSNSDKKAAEREASNSPIQGCVADLLAQAGILFYMVKYQFKIPGGTPDFRILLPIHDAFLIESKAEHENMKRVYDIITKCMSTANKIPKTGGRYLGVDMEEFDRWGVH